MLKKLWKLIRTAISVAVMVIVLYVIALMFDMVPDAYMPKTLFPEQYKQFMQKLNDDSKSGSATANLSKHLSTYLNDMDKDQNQKNPTNDANNPNSSATPAASSSTASGTNTQPTSTGIAPLDKAKQSVQNYNDQQQKEKQQLDNL